MFGKIKDKIVSLTDRIQNRLLREPLSPREKALIIAGLAIFVIGGAMVAYFIFDYTQNDPSFCVSCHLMQPAFDTWALSAHKGLNCHDCHHLTIPEQNMLLVNFVLHRPTTVPERHGQVIVSKKYCIECHIEGKETRGKAPSIKDSNYHMKHVVEKNIECTQCHGEVKADKTGLHRFLPTEKFCVKCHEGKKVHGHGMGELACINCHTDRTKNLRPGRKKCLFCHSADKNIRKELEDDASFDVRYFHPDESVIKKATKISYSDKAPMQFYCYECHHPHTKGKVRPNNDECLRCHGTVKTAGKHEVHLAMDMKCQQCHKPHLWKVTEDTAKKTCGTCHEYRSPKTFLK